MSLEILLNKIYTNLFKIEFKKYIYNKKFRNFIKEGKQKLYVSFWNDVTWA